MNRFIGVMRATALKELRVWRRNKSRLGLIVLLPIVYWMAFNLLMGGVYSSGVETALVLEESDPGYYTNGLIEILSAHDDIPPSLLINQMDMTTAQAGFESGEILLVIIIPSGFEAALSGNESTSVTIWMNNFHEDATKNLQMPVIRKLDIFYQTFLNESVDVTFETELLYPYTYPRLAYMAWTTAIYAVMFGSLFTSGSAMTQEFENETFDELDLSNQSPLAIHTGKMLAGIGLSYIPVVLLFTLAFLMFGVWPRGDLAVFILLTLLLALVSSGVGLVLGALLRDSVYMVPTGALLCLVYWIVCGGIAPMLIGGVSFGVVDSYSPISNAYRSLITMFVDGTSDTLGIDSAVLGIAAIASLALSPLVANRLSRVSYSRILAAVSARRGRT